MHTTVDRLDAVQNLRGARGRGIEHLAATVSRALLSRNILLLQRRITFFDYQKANFPKPSN
jgi:hypothetical protein